MNDQSHSPFAGGGDMDLTAAEYVVGTLDLRERVAFSQLLRNDPEARRAVSAWEARLGGLIGVADAVTPPQELWDRIERATRNSGAKPHALKVIDGGGRPGAELALGLTQSRNRWRAAALAASAVAAALVVFVAGDKLRAPEVSPPSETYVAAINRGGDKPALIVRVDLKTRRILVRPVAAEAPNDHSLELWYIDAGKPPQSMGLVARAPETLSMPADAKAAAATFAVSVEPPGGSKTGSPTGPVIYSGQLVKE